MTTITDQFMKESLLKTKPYTVVLLKAGPSFVSSDAEHLIWEHDRCSFALRQEGALAIVCPVADDSELCEVSIFKLAEREVRKIMDADPAVVAGVLTYDVHLTRSFPDDSLA